MNKRQHPRPAAMGFKCDTVFYNPNYQPDSDTPLLLRCHDTATLRIVITDPTDTYAVKRCPVCAEVLRAKEAGGATFEILSEEKL